MDAVYTKKSSRVKTVAGESLRPLEQDVALHSTPTGRPLFADSEEAVVVLVAMLVSLMSNVLSEDVIALSIYSAKKMAKESGISDEEFERVVKGLYKFWARKKASNPIGGMF